MAMTPLPAGEAGEDPFNNTINTTPLVDVMLVLLIIFLITVPVVTQTIALELPKERNVPAPPRPDHVVLSVDRNGTVHWGLEPLPGLPALQQRLREVAARSPQPEVHIRADERVAWQAVDRVNQACLQAGIGRIGFITEPPAAGGRL
jgi:biopolymer transport protein ExbD